MHHSQLEKQWEENPHEIQDPLQFVWINIVQKNTGPQSTSDGPVLEEMGTDQALMKIIFKKN